MTYYKKFDSGLRLIVKKIEGLWSVSTGIIVGTGSTFETDGENGISHFIEHMMFKGTDKRTAFEISDAMDRIVETTYAMKGDIEVVIPQTNTPRNIETHCEKFFKYIDEQREMFEEDFSTAILDDYQEAIPQLLYRLKRLQ